MVNPSDHARLEQLRASFAEDFQRDCAAIARAPGRINLIGEHTDYNDGFVLPIAIEQATWVAAAPRSDGRVRVCSREFAGVAEWPLNAWRESGCPPWTAYCAGVAALLARRGARLEGADLRIASDVPPSAGVSSSAALCVATLLALAQVCGEPLESLEAIDLCREAEHEFAGVPCGAMDFAASLLSRAGSAMLLDCRKMEPRHIAWGSGRPRFVLIHSGVRRDLTSGHYARRRAECEAAVAYFATIQRDVRALRDVSVETVRAHAQQMDPVAAARAAHVASENRRTQAFAAAMGQGDVATMGRLMIESHASLRDDFEASCPPADRLVRRVCEVPGVHGARLTGGGFGGCVVALADDAAAARIAAALDRWSASEFPKAAMLFVTAPGAGASLA